MLLPPQEGNPLISFLTAAIGAMLAIGRDEKAIYYVHKEFLEY